MYDFFCLFRILCWLGAGIHLIEKRKWRKKKTVAKATVSNSQREKKKSHKTWDCNFQCTTQMKMNMIILRVVYVCVKEFVASIEVQNFSRFSEANFCYLLEWFFC